jgi:hypothetical protein
MMVSAVQVATGTYDGIMAMATTAAGNYREE